MKLIFALFLSLNLCAQIGTGEWRMHVPNVKPIDVVVGNNIVYTAYDGGLLEYDITSSEKSLWTDVNYLSDISLTCLEFYEPQNALFIGYENGNIDKIENNTVTNIPAIRLAQVSGSKRINKIVEYGKFIYVATGFAIVKIDPLKEEVKDTYYPTNGNEPILDIAFRNDSIYAITSTKLYRGFAKNNNLADPSSWVIDTRIPVATGIITYKDVETINDELFVLKTSSVYQNDSIIHIKTNGNSTFSDQTNDLEIRSLENLNGKLAINSAGGVFIFNSDYTTYVAGFIISPGGVDVYNSFVTDEVYWLADNLSGLVRFENGGISKISFSGPPKNEFYFMDCFKSKLVVAGGGLNGKQKIYSSSGFYVFEDENWTSHDRNNTPLWLEKNIWDFISASINPVDNKIAIGTYSEQAISIVESNNEVSEVFTLANSNLEPTMNGGVDPMIKYLQYDTKGNLWIANSYSTTPLKVYTKDKVWQAFPLGSSLINKSISKIVIDYNDNKWLVVEGVGLVGLNDNKTIDVLSDDKMKILNSGENSGALPSNEVTALAVDFDNEIWIGTDSGFSILYNSSSIFDAVSGGYNSQRIKLDYQGIGEHMLGKTYITDIEVDGGNRKWFATQNAGIFLLSPDGTEILATYTTENSPIISNNIVDLKFDHATGELFIITDIGLVSFRTDASYGDPENANVNVFPNPVLPEFDGVITIQGIQYDSDVHVTDAAGNLVYKTTSNGGTATWNGKTLLGEKVKAGVYLFWTASNEVKGRKVGKVTVIN